MTHPANWYPDPSDPLQWRWFDGTAWTEHVAPTTTSQAQQPQATTMTPGRMAVSPTPESILIRPGSPPIIFPWLGLLGLLSVGIIQIQDRQTGSATAIPALPIVVLSVLSGLLAAGFYLYLRSQTREPEPGFPVLF